MLRSRLCRILESGFWGPRIAALTLARVPVEWVHGGTANPAGNCGMEGFGEGRYHKSGREGGEQMVTPPCDGEGLDLMTKKGSIKGPVDCKLPGLKVMNQ